MMLSPEAKKTAIAALILQLSLISIMVIHTFTRSRDFRLLRAWINLVPVSATAFSAADSGARFPELRSRDQDRLDVLRDSDPLLFIFEPYAKR